MEIIHRKENGVDIALLSGPAGCIADAAAALEAAMSARHETGASRLVIDKRLLAEDFFILSTGLHPLYQQAPAGLYLRVQLRQGLLLRGDGGGGRPQGGGGPVKASVFCSEIF